MHLIMMVITRNKASKGVRIYKFISALCVPLMVIGVYGAVSSVYMYNYWDATLFGLLAASFAYDFYRFKRISEE